MGNACNLQVGEDCGDLLVSMMPLLRTVVWIPGPRPSPLVPRDPPRGRVSVQRGCLPGRVSAREGVCRESYPPWGGSDAVATGEGFSTASFRTAVAGCR